MIAAVRIRGNLGLNRKKREILRRLGLVRTNYVGFYDDSMKETLREVESTIAWGEAGEDLLKKMEGKRKYKGRNVFRLQPPKGGFKAVRLFYPKGDLGYRGKEIENLIIRMLR